LIDLKRSLSLPLGIQSLFAFCAAVALLFSRRRGFWSGFRTLNGHRPDPDHPALIIEGIRAFSLAL
jgi:hypothetical protein